MISVTSTFTWDRQWDHSYYITTYQLSSREKSYVSRFIATLKEKNL